MRRAPGVLAFLLLVLPPSAVSQEWSRLLQTADSLFELHSFDAAIRTGQEALFSAERSGIATDTMRGLVAHRLGLYHYLAGILPQADSLFTEAEELRERALGPQHADLARTVMNHSLVFGAMGDVVRYRQSLLRSVEMRPDSPFVAAFLNLGTSYVGEGDYAAAEYYLNEALVVQQRLYPGDEVLHMQCLFALGYFRLSQGYYAECLRLNAEALEISRRLLGRTHYWTQNILTNLTAGYGNLGQARKAIGAAREDLEVQSHWPDNPSRRALTLLNIAVQYNVLGELDSAEATADAALHIVDSTGGFRPGHSQFLATRAGIAADGGDVRAADSLFSLAVSLWSRESPTLGQMTQTPERASAFYRRRGEVGRALALGRQAVARWKAVFPGVAARASDRDARTYADVRAHALTAYLSAFLDAAPHADSTVREAADLILTSKGSITESHFQRNAAWRARLDSGARALQSAYETMQAGVAGLFVESLSDPAAGIRLDSARRELQRAENDLARVSGDFRALKDQADVTASSIARALPPGSVAVEYLRYSYAALSPDTLEDHYLAVVINDRDSISIRDLGPAVVIDREVLRYRRHFAGLTRLPDNASASEYRSIARAFSRLVWKPLEPFVRDADVVMVSPDGGLNLVSFAALEHSSGKYLIERHAVHTLTAVRDLLRPQEGGSESAGLLALADPDFSERIEPALTPSAASRPPHERVFRSACLDSLRPAPLPFARKEAESVRGYWGTSRRGGDVHLLVGPRATEEEFRRSAGGRSVLHLATHGFFLQGTCGGAGASGDPLLESGLFLAGAGIRGPRRLPPDQDGVLTALELSSYDLRGTDLVVLSACETGLGEARQGEGVYGVRRALQMAGARTVISTLWNVPDLETMTFMKALYVPDGRTYPEVMRGSALRMIREADLRRRPRHPLTWGAFVATGDWRIPGR